MKPLGYKYIFGRLTFYVEDETLEARELTALWVPLEGEEFDVIHINPHFQNPKQAILHEELHGVLDRIGAHQIGLSEESEEIIVEAISRFVSETYKI